MPVLNSLNPCGDFHLKTLNPEAANGFVSLGIRRLCSPPAFRQGERVHSWKRTLYPGRRRIGDFGDAPCSQPDLPGTLAWLSALAAIRCFTPFPVLIQL